MTIHLKLHINNNTLFLLIVLIFKIITNFLRYATPAIPYDICNLPLLLPLQINHLKYHPVSAVRNTGDKLFDLKNQIVYFFLSFFFDQDSSGDHIRFFGLIHLH